MKLPKQMFEPSLEKAVKDYHEWHGDRNVKLMCFICDAIGESLLLTRVTDEQGNKLSCLLEFYYMNDDDGWDIREYNHSERDDEPMLIQCYMGSYPESADEE